MFFEGVKVVDYVWCIKDMFSGEAVSLGDTTGVEGACKGAFGGEEGSGGGRWFMICKDTFVEEETSGIGETGHTAQECGIGDSCSDCARGRGQYLHVW